MLDHLVGLLLRALNAQVTGAKPLQVQPAHRARRGLGSPNPSINDNDNDNDNDRQVSRGFVNALYAALAKVGITRLSVEEAATYAIPESD